MTLTFLDAEAGSKRIPQLSPEAELAVFARALFRNGYSDNNNGHMTSRQSDDTFLILSQEIGWDEARPEDVLRIDIDGNLLDGSGSVMPPIILHLEYHRLHPECTWTMHQHPMYSTVWAAIGRVPPVYSQTGASLLDRIGLYDDFEGSVDGVRAARSAAAAVGDKKAVLLRNHGVFVVGDDVRQIFSRSVALENMCRLAWHVEAISNGRAREMPDYGRQAMVDLNDRLFQDRYPGLWEWAARRELRADPTLVA